MAYREVPIDISPYLEGGSDYARERVAVALDEELRFSGFARISGHGIPASVIAGLDDAMTTLFSLDDDDKQRWRYSESNRGWVPARHETQSLSLGVPSPTGLADWVEVFDVGISPPDYRHVQVEGIAYAESVWPDIPQFRRRVDTYFSEAGRVVHGVMHILGDALGLGRTFFDAYDDLS
jgi:isopenicillin N synthase-like dioxygenase